MTTIRAAARTDAEALARLSGELGYPADTLAIGRRLGEISAHHAGAVLVAVDAQGGVCGFAHARPERSVITDPFIDLAALVVAETARGAGVGKALLAAVEAWARQQAFTTIRVRSSVVRERAHQFYLREGYVENKRQAVFLKQLPSRDAT
ncbi:MAG TPA: GNAT family N-acetyltransferase [Rhodanobacteraceae bacterium]|nr:GNAT family N-acetyltransferase [Rhodanobacteraceae bacterium]